jgi:hypothetical protein
MKNPGFSLMGAGVLIGIVVHAFGQSGAPKRAPWLEPFAPTRIEWLALQKQATEGQTNFGDNGVTINFYLGPESMRTGEILCDLAYLPGTRAELVQMIEDGIQGRFETARQRYPWARVRIIKKVVN